MDSISIPRSTPQGAFKKCMATPGASCVPRQEALSGVANQRNHPWTCNRRFGRARQFRIASRALATEPAASGSERKSMMLNWDLAVIGSRLLGRADPRAPDKEVAWSPEQGAIVAMPAKAIDRMVSTARGFERIGFEPGQ